MPYTDREFLTTLRAVADEFPTRVYHKPDGAQCFYQLKDTPKGPMRCIIGETLHRMGIKIQPMWDVGDGWSASAVLTEFDAGLRTKSVAQTVQAYQDSGMEWKAAVDLVFDSLGVTL